MRTCPAPRGTTPWPSASLSCDVTETRKLPPPSDSAGAVCVGLVAATRVGGSDSDACGASDIGELALALADAGLRAGGSERQPGQ